MFKVRRPAVRVAVVDDSMFIRMAIFATFFQCICCLLEQLAGFLEVPFVMPLFAS